MFIRAKKICSATSSLVRFALLLPLILCVFIVTSRAQTAEKISHNASLPVWQNYKGVTLGMSADEVRSKLGEPKTEDATGYFYVFSDTETAQILLDGSKKVRAISTIFDAEHRNAPKFADVFGKSAEAQPKPDGSMYKMVRFEDAGYWVSYSRTAGDKAMVIVMIQKL